MYYWSGYPSNDDDDAMYCETFETDPLTSLLKRLASLLIINSEPTIYFLHFLQYFTNFVSLLETFSVSHPGVHSFQLKNL